MEVVIFLAFAFCNLRIANCTHIDGKWKYFVNLWSW